MLWISRNCSRKVHPKWNPEIWIWRDSSNNFANYFSIVVCLSRQWISQLAKASLMISRLCGTSQTPSHMYLPRYITWSFKFTPPTGSQTLHQVRNNSTQNVLLCKGGISFTGMKYVFNQILWRQCYSIYNQTIWIYVNILGVLL